MKRYCSLLFVALVSSGFAQERISDQIYMKSGGAAFTLDVFKVANPNAPCVIWLVSGGWVSDHSQISPDIAKAFNDQGIAVVEVVHGAQPRYTLTDIVPMIKRAVRYVHANATRFGINPNKIGISGGSAGGHLSLMIGGTGDAGNPDAKDPIDRAPSTVNAVGVYMPPTDFMNWGKEAYTPFGDPKMAIFMPAFGVNKDTPRDKAEAIGKLMSPINYVSPKFPPTMIVHGDKDALVPIQQAQSMDAALAKQGVDHTLITIAGGGHDAVTFLGGAQRLIAWFKEKLK